MNRRSFLVAVAAAPVVAGLPTPDPDLERTLRNLATYERWYLAKIAEAHRDLMFYGSATYPNGDTYQMSSTYWQSYDTFALAGGVEPKP